MIVLGSIAVAIGITAGVVYVYWNQVVPVVGVAVNMAHYWGAIQPSGKCKTRMPRLITADVLQGPRTVRKLQR